MQLPVPHAIVVELGICVADKVAGKRLENGRQVNYVTHLDFALNQLVSFFTQLVQGTCLLCRRIVLLFSLRYRELSQWYHIDMEAIPLNT